MNSAAQPQPPAVTNSGTQLPTWPDDAALRTVTDQLGACIPLVLPGECDRLTKRLTTVSRGEAFLLQGGDCAETFDSLTHRSIERKLNTLSEMSATVQRASSLPVVVLARMAGQYAKPRSKPLEVRDGVTLPAYRGDAVNGLDFTEQARSPDPRRMLRAYTASSSTLNAIRALVAYPTDPSSPLSGSDVFVSHEGLLLDYETALTRTEPRSGRRYAGSGHLLWVGERTRDVSGPHVDHLAEISNPVGVKVGPTAEPDELIALIERLDPDRTPGRLTFIVRSGANQVREQLPALVEKVAASGARPIWICDPMHGNTFTAPSAHKTRSIDDIVDEIRGFFEVHRSLGTHPGGVHVEMTGEEVTECVDDVGVGLDDLPKRYESACDPRLNRSQSLRLGQLVSELAAGRRNVPPNA